MMSDREKVIKELTCCIYSEEERECPEDCPYIDDGECQAKVMRDALALLKEQEAEIEQLNRFVNGFSRGAVVPVRCKDCKHGRQYDTNAIDCEYRELATEPDWFCADGELR